MAIASAVQKGTLIYIYDQSGRNTATINARGGLHGYTSSTVTVRDGNLIHTFGERGQHLGTRNGR